MEWQLNTPNGSSPLDLIYTPTDVTSEQAGDVTGESDRLSTVHEIGARPVDSTDVRQLAAGFRTLGYNLATGALPVLLKKIKGQGNRA